MSISQLLIFLVVDGNIFLGGDRMKKGSDKAKKQLDKFREGYKKLACDYIEQLKRGELSGSELEEIFFGVINIMGQFGFDFEDVAVTEEEWLEIANKVFGVKTK